MTINICSLFVRTYYTYFTLIQDFNVFPIFLHEALDFLSVESRSNMLFFVNKNLDMLRLRFTDEAGLS